MAKTTIEFPDVYSYETAEVKFNVNGKGCFAVIRSLRTPEAQKALRKFGLLREKYKDELTPNKADDVAAFGLELDESGETETSAKITAYLCKQLIKDTDCKNIDDALIASETLRDVIYDAASKLAASFVEQKKS